MSLAIYLALSQLAQDPQLLADINTQNFGPQDSAARLLVEDAGSLWLTARDHPWRFDPATDEALQLNDSFVVSGPAIPAGGGRLVQRLRESTGVNALFATDGTSSGSGFLLYPPSNSLRSEVFAWAGGAFFLATIENGSSLELWQTDGTTAGTSVVQVLPGPELFGPTQLAQTVAAGRLFVGAGASGLISLSGPTATPTELGQGAFFQAEFDHPIEFAGQLCFAAQSGSSGYEPWISDGTLAGTFRLANIDPIFDSSPEFLAADANRAWFSAFSSPFGRELYFTDGTPAGTRRVVDLAPGNKQGLPAFATEGSPQTLAILLPGGDLLFSGSNDTSFGGLQQNFELWRTDGTAAGTQRVADLNPGLLGGEPRDFVEFGGEIFFGARTAGNGRELLRTDGTTQGTVLAVEFGPGEAGGDPALFQALGSLWIIAEDPALGVELFRSDGTQAGTSLAFEFAPQTSADGVAFASFEPLRLGTDLLFAATSEAEGNELWATDGTPAGTRLVVDLAPGAAGSNPGGSNVLGVAIGDRAFFVADDGGGRRVFVTDGTAAGTAALSDPAFASNPRHLVRLRDSVLFTAGFQATEELWASDGTPQGTLELADVQTNFFGQVPGLQDSAELDGVLYFYGRDAAGVQSIWRSDGTPAGTGSYAVVPTNGLQQPYGFLRDPDQLLFFAADGTGGFGLQLGSLDGTPGGVNLMFPVDFGLRRAVRFLDGHLVVPDNNAAGDLWFTDGTPAGTYPLTTALSSTSWLDRTLVVIGDRAYFEDYLSGGVNENVWWSTDGTPAGTAPLTAPNALELDAFTAHDDLGSLEQVVFGAFSAQVGAELWRLDPQTGAQDLLIDLFPGAGSSRPTGSAEINGRLVFDASSPEFGRELFAISLADIGVPSAEATGGACGSSVTAPRLNLLGELRPGGTFELRLDDAPPGAVSVALRSVPSPWIGLGGGCAAVVDLASAKIFAVQGTDALGAARTTLTLPANPALAGLALSAQSVVVEVGGPLFGQLAATNGVDVVLAP